MSNTPASRLLALAAGTVPEFSPIDVVKSATKAEWNASGIWYDDEIWVKSQTRELRSILSDSPIVPLDIEVIFIEPGPIADSSRRMIEVGAEIGARNALIVSLDPDLQATTDKLAEICDFADDHGIQANFEYLPITYVGDIQTALSVTQTIKNVGLMPDLLHVIRSGGDVSDIAKIPAGKLHYAQLCDGFAEVEIIDEDTLYDDAMDGRCLAGAGELPVREFMKALPADIPISMEIRRKALRQSHPDLDKRVAYVLSKTQAFFNSLS